LKQLSGTQIQVRQSPLGSFLLLQPMRLDLPQMAIKRTMDVVLTTAGLAVVWPLFMLIAVAVKLDSKGPVIFRQRRMGVGGRPFEILKFRTMVVDAEAQKASLQHLNEYSDGRLFKIKRDPRVTRVGRILRRTSLDELPQLWNVLRGEMSLVGPRPCVPEEMATYAPHHMERLFVVPGVTGPWQVNGRNTITDFEQVVRLDQEYIRTWSIASDLLILLKTLPSLLGRGAY
jgi:exopolysaccharide biosynthesis polyprenyl glycosylphosphotransferase